MSKVKTKTLYDFGEMIDQDQPGVEKAREWMREAATGDEYWYESAYEMWKEALYQIGFENANISFSGFWCQGDGASFTADVDAEKLLQFMGTKIEGKECIGVDADGKEDFRPYVVHLIGGVHFDHRYKWLADIAVNYIEASCTRDIGSRYSHENTCTFDATLNDDASSVPGRWIDSDPPGKGYWKSGVPNVVELFLEFVKDAEQLRLDLSKAIYKWLNDEYDYRTSDEMLREDSEANEYLFDESGHRENL